MGRWQSADLRGGVVAALAVPGFAWAGGTLALGAHPWWALKLGWLGAGIGVVIWLGLRLAGLGRRATVGLAALVLAAAAVVTAVGKARFAASFAEDALAGRMWFFGWIGIMAAAFVLIAALAGGTGRSAR